MVDGCHAQAALGLDIKQVYRDVQLLWLMVVMLRQADLQVLLFRGTWYLIGLSACGSSTLASYYKCNSQNSMECQKISISPYA